MDNSIQNIIKGIDDAIAKFQNAIPGIQKLVYEELQPLLKDLKIKDGKLLNNIENLKAIGNIKNKMERIIVGAQYKKQVEDFVNSFTDISNLNNDYFAQFNKKFKPRNTLPLVKMQAVEATINGLLGQGLNSNIIDPITKILNQNITTGGNYASFQEQVRNHILTDETGSGTLERYTKQITTDALHQYNAQYAETIAQDLNFSWGRYVGSNLITSRQFCILLTAKQWVHKSELPKIIEGTIDGKALNLSKITGLPIGMIPGTNADNFKIRRGGYQCGHQFFWVPDSSVPDDVKRKLIEPKVKSDLKVDLKVLKTGPFGRIFNDKAEQKKLSVVHQELSKEEKTAVNTYTLDDYYTLNRSLRGASAISPYNENLKILLSQAIDNFNEKFTGWVFRGTSLNKENIKPYYDAFKDKSNVKHSFFTSTSNTIGSEFNGNVKYSIYSKRGVAIEKLSHHKHEKEVLLNVDTEFKILSIREKEGVTYIKMEEI